MTSTAQTLSPDRSWVTIFTGEPWRVALLEGELESAGILTLVPDRMMKMIDPFATGSNPLNCRLQVPNFQLAEALEIINAEPPGPEATDAQGLD